jgi:hypothetical protein
MIIDGDRLMLDEPMPEHDETSVGSEAKGRQPGPGESRS